MMENSIRNEILLNNENINRNININNSRDNLTKWLIHNIRINIINPCKENRYLLFCMISLLISSIFNSVFFKKMTSSMPNHVWFLTQLTTALYIPLFGSVILISYLRNELSDENFQVPLKTFWIMGLFDGVGSILTLFGSIHTSGAMQVVLGQMCTPITLIMLSIICKDNFHKLQYIGALIMIFGILIVKSGIIFGFRENNISEKSNILIFNIIFVLSCIPASASSVYKDFSFRQYSTLNENYLQFFVALTQVIIGFLLVPINTLSVLGPLKIELNEIPWLLFQGANCLFLRKNTIINECGGEIQRPCDNCEIVQLPVLIYFLANVVCNIFSILVLKHGTATSAFIISTLRLPLTTLVFFSPKLVGDEATKPNIEDFIGIFILIIGLILYRLGSVKNREEYIDDYYELSLVKHSEESIDNKFRMNTSTTCSFNIEDDSKY